MILGSLNAAMELTLDITLVVPQGGTHTETVVIDTGLSSGLMLPADVISRLGLRRVARRLFMLADGSRRRLRTFRAEVEWDGTRRTVEVVESGTQSLLGMELLFNHRVTFDAVPGGALTLTALP